MTLLPTASMLDTAFRYLEPRSAHAAGVPGLEPRLTGPEPVGLPITPYPMGSSPAGPVRLSSLAEPREYLQPSRRGPLPPPRPPSSGPGHYLVPVGDRVGERADADGKLTFEVDPLAEPHRPLDRIAGTAYRR